MGEYAQIVTTTEHKEDLERIVGILVRNSLAACAQIIGPISGTPWYLCSVEL